MSKALLFILSIVVCAACRQSEDIAPENYQCALPFQDTSASHPEDQSYQEVLDDMITKGVVGVSMAVFHPDQGMWLGTSGMADLHNQVPLQSCNILRVGSTVKMFTATTILLLMEEGKLGLDDKIADYLDGDVVDKIENADRATIRQLLQHSSGMYNYIQDLQFQTASLNDLIREWKPEDLLRYAYGRNACFEPGTDVRYSNTGYILLGMLIEHIEAKPFYEVFEEKLFQPLNLTMTQFAAIDPVPANIVRGYIDLYSKLEVVESTYFSGWDYYSADGGLISNPLDLNIFFQALMNGEIIQPSSLTEMLKWKTPSDPDPEFFPIAYGLGIFRMETPYGVAYMHSGDAIGYYANMIYFPDDGSTITYAVNSNYGKIDQFVSSREAIEDILSVTR